MAEIRHLVSHRNGPQVMVAGLKLRRLGYARGASVVVTHADSPSAEAWRFTVPNDEHSTLTCRHPPPPAWVQPGVTVVIDIAPPGGRAATVAPPPRRSDQRQAVTALGEPRREARDGARFDVYLFADYSGARVVGDAIVPAIAVGEGAPTVIEGPFTRPGLVELFVNLLTVAHRLGLRVLFGVDHQYGLPLDFGVELELPTHSWREALRALNRELQRSGDGGELTQAEAARRLNERLREPYFWSATNAVSFRLPGRDPRRGHDTTRRLTERRRELGGPKPLNRIGDPGSVGGQTLLGLPRLLELLDSCEARAVPVAAWPFDDLELTSPAYEGRHVLVELYPSAVRAEGVPQSDVNDALAAVEYLQRVDTAGRLAGLMDLSQCSTADRERIQFEGWILAGP